ncbi:MAG TPA: polyhydroxyalkanoic acid system family protein [Thiopseudomonas sp.]|nr:polyhydroxyalkanoic acid system family protein [Thiopseudomonas sp.]
MSQIIVEREHCLGFKGAREQAQHLAERLAQQYAVSYCWDGDTLNVRRTGAQGTIVVDETRVRVSLKLGLLFSALSGTIKTEIEQALDKRLG